MERMGNVRRKKRREWPWLRWVLLGAALLALGGSLLAVRLMQGEETVKPLPVEAVDTTLVRHAATEVQSITMVLRSGDGWTVTQDADGALWCEGPDRFRVAEDMAGMLLDAACVVKYTEVLSEDPSEYADRLEDFGLADPRAVVQVAYTDGTGLTMRIGEKAGNAETAFYFMLVDGDDRLLALDVGTKDDLVVERALLHPVVQPVIHEARIDAIRVSLPQGEYAWTLQGTITDGDAADRWTLVRPMQYPADGAQMDKMRTNLANLRLGSYVADADEASLAAYGFEQPRMTLTVHMAAGSLGTTGLLGTYGVTDWPEGEVMLTVGNASSDMLDYVLFDGTICTTAHFLLEPLMEVDPGSTLTRYPVLTSLGNLAALTVEQDGRVDRYVVTRTEQVAANNDLVLDEAGNVVTEVTVTRNGEPMAWRTFEAAYNDLLLVTVSGTLPDGARPEGPVHTALRFQTVTGVEHSIELVKFDALHDAVLVDGYAMFYLVKGGLRFEPAGD